MCWMYGGKKNCGVCKRIKADEARFNANTIIDDPPYLKAYSADSHLPETTRLTRNHYLRNALFENDHVKETEKSFASVYQACSDDFYNRISKKRRKNTIEQKIKELKESVDIPLGCRRLFKFLAVLELFDGFHWANIRFKENEKMMKRLIASHLKLIVGEAEYKLHSTLLFNMIDATMDLASLKHVVWVTHRQAGKTTTLSKFLAVMSLMSIKGGPLLYVYSTAQHRSIELIDGARRYIDEARSKHADALAAIGITIGPYRSNNNQMYSIESCMAPGTFNIVRARPKNADSCRGDSPAAALFDEIGFVTGDFWYQFALPLIGVDDRIFTLATTPPHRGSHFSQFLKLTKEQNAEGNFLFTLFNQDMHCEECAESNAPRCCHLFDRVPPWKPVTGYKNIKDFVANERQGDYKKEFLGIIDGDTDNYFPEKWVNHYISPKNKHKLIGLPTTNKIYVPMFIDPPSHKKSQMGLKALVNAEGNMDAKNPQPGGAVYLVGGGQIGVNESKMLELQKIITTFVTKLFSTLITKDHPASQWVLVPMVETSNNEFQSRQLMDYAMDAANLVGVKSDMPFVPEVFAKHISPYVGVYTDRIAKYGGIARLNDVMREKRLYIWSNYVVVGNVHLIHEPTPTQDSIIDVLAKQLLNYRETDKGPSGKGDGDNDDMATALILLMYWDYTVDSTGFYKK